jgi:hypothetical protein
MHPFSYRHVPASVKIAATSFLVLAVLGLGVAVLQIYAKTGLSAQGALGHYRGDDATLQYAKSFNEMVEVTHAHAFMMPLLALVLSAGLVLSSAAEWFKRVIVSALFLGVTLELGVPWLVRYGPLWTVHLFGVAGLLLGAGLLVAVAVPLYEMWVPHPNIHDSRACKRVGHVRGARP